MDYNKLTYDERQALAVVRKLLKRKPEMAGLLIKDMTKEAAVSLLRQGQKELEDLLAFNRALSTAAGAIATPVKDTKETPC